MFNSVNLIVDGAFFFKRSLAVCDFGNSSNILSTEKHKKIFTQRIATDFANQMKKFEDLNVRRVVFTNEFQSWRKQEFPEYKSNRKRDTEIDWDGYNEVASLLLGELKKYNVIESTQTDCEGDDLIYYWSKVLKKKDELNIIVASDNDLKQLVSRNTIHHNIITNKYALTKELYEDLTTETKVNTIYDMSSASVNANTFVKFFKDQFDRDSNYSIIDVPEFVLEKVLLGDSGDGISSVATRYGQKTVEKTIGEIKILTDITTDFVNNIEDHVEFLAENVMKLKPKENMTEVEAKIKRNYKLVYLNYRTIPESITKAFKSNLNDTKDLLHKKVKNRELSDERIILQDTKYSIETPKESNEFFGVDTSAL